jgi:NhaP-type Na+/H+ or K+/H+ antiporter
LLRCRQSARYQAMDTYLIYFTAVISLGILAQWLAWRFKLPSILLLLAFGFAFGQLYQGGATINSQVLFPLVSLAVAIILLEGGLTLRFRELREAGDSVLRLVLLGAAITWLMAAAAAHWIIGMPWGVALLLGSVLVVTGPTVIAPLLRHIKPARRVASVLKWEGIVIDPVGALLAVLVFQWMSASAGVEGHGGGDSALGATLISLGKTFAIGAGLGYAAARLLVFLMRRHWIPDFLQSVVLLSVGVAVFTASNLLQHESGLLTVTVLGIALANQTVAPVRHIIEFKENLRVLLISCLFIVLAGRVQLEELAAIWKQALLFLAALILLVRPISVFLATIGTQLDNKEKLFISWMAPRGIVAAAVASVFALEMAEASHAGGAPSAWADAAASLVPITFVVIVGTVMVYGFTSAPLARKLGLAMRNPQGIIFAGIQDWNIAVGEILKELGYGVLFIDSNHQATARARMAGLRTYNASILSEYVTEEVDLTGLGQLVVTTPNDQVNAMACNAFAHTLGRSNIYQLQPQVSEDNPREAVAQDMWGRILFPSKPTYLDIRDRIGAGFVVARTPLTEEFTMENLRERSGNSALLLFIVRASGELRVATQETGDPGAGDVVISLMPPDAGDNPDVEARFQNQAGSDGEGQE